MRSARRPHHRCHPGSLHPPPLPPQPPDPRGRRPQRTNRLRALAYAGLLPSDTADGHLLSSLEGAAEDGDDAPPTTTDAHMSDAPGATRSESAGEPGRPPIRAGHGDRVWQTRRARPSSPRACCLGRIFRSHERPPGWRRRRRRGGPAVRAGCGDAPERGYDAADRLPPLMCLDVVGTRGGGPPRK